MWDKKTINIFLWSNPYNYNLPISVEFQCVELSSGGEPTSEGSLKI